MKEILYKYNNSGMYTNECDTSFGSETQMKIIAEPHEFSISISGDVLRSSSFDGCIAVVSCDGEAAFYDNDNNLICKSDKGNCCYKEARFQWKQGSVSILFGHVETVDYYPNCDGEHDRWGEEWITDRKVTLDLQENSLVIE